MSSKLKEKDKGGKFLMKLWSCVGGKLGRIKRDNLVLPTELIGHR